MLFLNNSRDSEEIIVRRIMRRLERHFSELDKKLVALRAELQRIEELRHEAHSVETKITFIADTQMKSADTLSVKAPPPPQRLQIVEAPEIAEALPPLPGALAESSLPSTPPLPNSKNEVFAASGAILQVQPQSPPPVPQPAPTSVGNSISPNVDLSSTVPSSFEPLVEEIPGANPPPAPPAIPVNNQNLDKNTEALLKQAHEKAAELKREAKTIRSPALVMPDLPSRPFSSIADSEVSSETARSSARGPEQVKTVHPTNVSAVSKQSKSAMSDMPASQLGFADFEKRKPSTFLGMRPGFVIGLLLVIAVALGLYYFKGSDGFTY